MMEMSQGGWLAGATVSTTYMALSKQKKPFAH